MVNQNQLNLFNIVLVGRPNVGKSSIFNFLIGNYEAKVEDFEGTTMDWRSKQIGNIIIWDTPGSFDLNFPPCEVDLVYFVIDSNVLHYDKEFYLKLKAKFKNILVIINKIDLGEDFDYSFFDNFIKISFRTRYNIFNLKSMMMDNYDNNFENKEKKIWAILGRPNVGKSSLINLLFQKDIHKVEDFEGTTKEFLPVDIEDNILLDTPGQRKKAIFPKYADIFGLIIMVDFNQEKQDLRLIDLAFKRNKPIFVIINKIDLANKKEMEFVKNKISKLWNVEIFYISCKKNIGIHSIKNYIKIIENNFFKRIPTAKLNSWLSENIRQNEPSIKFITQIETGFPKFFCGTKLTIDKERMLKKRLTDFFNFKGIPIKIIYEKQEN